MRQPVVGMHLNACSLHQLQTFGSHFPGAEVGIRFNPGLGSGSTGKTNVGGPDASFGRLTCDHASVMRACDHASVIPACHHASVLRFSDACT